MRVDDAVERWAITHRPELALNETETVRLIWWTLRTADVGGLQVDGLDEAQSTEIMSLFDKGARPAVAGMLNSVSRWASGLSDVSASERRTVRHAGHEPLQNRAQQPRYLIAIVAAVILVITVASLYFLLLR